MVRARTEHADPAMTANQSSRSPSLGAELSPRHFFTACILVLSLALTGCVNRPKAAEGEGAVETRRLSDAGEPVVVRAPAAATTGRLRLKPTASSAPRLNNVAVEMTEPSAQIAQRPCDLPHWMPCRPKAEDSAEESVQASASSGLRAASNDQGADDANR